MPSCFMMHSVDFSWVLEFFTRWEHHRRSKKLTILNAWSDFIWTSLPRLRAPALDREPLDDNVVDPIGLEVVLILMDDIGRWMVEQIFNPPRWLRHVIFFRGRTLTIHQMMIITSNPNVSYMVGKRIKFSFRSIYPRFTSNAYFKSYDRLKLSVIT